MTDKRNIVLITFDSLRADHCSFMGYYRRTTPTIDKIAKKSIYFENAIASGVATPTSMFGVHTGTYPHATYAVDKLNWHEWKKEFRFRKTLAQVLKEHGYITGAIHANPAVSRFFGFNKGFDYFQDFMDGKEGKRKKNLLFKSLTPLSIVTSKFIPKINNFTHNVKVIIKKEETATDWHKLFQYILDFREIAKKEGKFYFLWVLLLDTHIPYIPPRESRQWCRLPTPYIVYLNWKVRRNYLNPNKISTPEKTGIMNAYDDSILYADKFIKTLINVLEDDDPIFIIHADHGEGFGEHNFFYHPAMLYEELIHVPLIIYNADIKGKIDNPVSLLGMAPSILELIGEENEFPSKSFLDWEEEVVISKVFDGYRWKISLRTKRWKFITGQKNKDELYDLKKDPHEKENVADDYPDLVKEMRKIIETHIKHEKEKEKIRKITFSLTSKVKN